MQACIASDLIGLQIHNFPLAFDGARVHHIGLSLVDVCELGDTFQDNIDQFHIERRSQLIEEWLHFFVVALAAFVIFDRGSCARGVIKGLLTVLLY